MDSRNDRRDLDRRVLVACIAAASLAACAPKYHTAAQYRFDPEWARSVADEADRLCAERGEQGAPLPPRPFVTDGCSIFPDGVWQRCCVEHDMRYWCGGTREQRCEADKDLQQCVAHSPGRFVRVIAPFMRAGVWIGGTPWLPTYWRWGYGYPWLRGYRSPSRDDDRP